MKVYIVQALKGRSRKEHSYSHIVGVFSDEKLAEEVKEAEEHEHGERYTYIVALFYVESALVDDEEVSLEERLEALEQYMSVAQRKIMALEAHLGSYHNYAEGPSTEELRRQWRILVNNQIGSYKKP
jgi:hypothetical protein